ncbi:MAG: aminotransferase class I/II-fold pyridoxal phosphate-dependent enzyme [Bacteroidota bacterium]
MAIVNVIPGRTVAVDGQEFLYFSGTSYLGMAQNKEFLALVQEGLRQYGANFGGSRLSNMQLAIFEEAEEFLAQFTGAAAALSVSSGSLAGQLIVRYFERLGKPLHFAPGTHPALWGKGTYSTTNYRDWTVEMLDRVAQHEQEVVLFCNSVDPLRVQLFDFEWLRELPKNKKTTIVIDDSHGLGVLGQQGAGVYALVPALEQLEVIVVASLGKALGVPGGVVLGSQSLVSELWRSPFFGGASPCVPAYLYAMVRAKELYRSAWQRLMERIDFLQQQAVVTTLFRSIPNYPVFYTPHNDLSPFLEECGMLLSSFPYPTPQDDCITRLVVSAAHEWEDLGGMVEGLGRMKDGGRRTEDE